MSSLSSSAPGSVGFCAAFELPHALSRAAPRAGSGDHDAAPELFCLILFSSVPWFGGSLLHCRSGREVTGGRVVLPLGHNSSQPHPGTACLDHAPELHVGS